MSQLVLHRGGWEATKADLASVPVPEPTDSYVPVPYGRFVEEVELHVPRFGLTIVSEQFALARDGQQMFGVLTCTNGHSNNEYGLAIALRNSYDRSLSAEITSSGTRVFCCDNLAFSGEVKVSIMQPSIEEPVKWDERYTEQTLRIYFTLTTAALGNGTKSQYVIVDYMHGAACGVDRELLRDEARILQQRGINKQ